MVLRRVLPDTLSSILFGEYNIVFLFCFLFGDGATKHCL